MVFNSLGTGYLLFSILHLVLLALAATVAGLYGTDVGSGPHPGGVGDGRWVYAIVVACMSAVTTLLYLVPFVLRFMLVWVWDLVLFVLWIALFGVFGKVRLPGRRGGPVHMFPSLRVTNLDLALHQRAHERKQHSAPHESRRLDRPRQRAPLAAGGGGHGALLVAPSGAEVAVHGPRKGLLREGTKLFLIVADRSLLLGAWVGWDAAVIYPDIWSLFLFAVLSS